MRIENVVAVTGGRLLNRPSISRFDTVALTPTKAVRGSLFIAKDIADIDAALKNGAYGIITDRSIVPTDTEIAWIRVESLSAALPKLLRLWLMINPRLFHLLPSFTTEFFRMLVCDQRAITLSDDPQKASEQILSSHQKNIIFCDDKTFLERIGASVSQIEPAPVLSKTVTKRLFHCSAIIEGVYYERLQLAECLYPLFLQTLGILKAAEISYTLSHLTYTSFFEPVFIDSRLNPLPFGEGERVLIFADQSLPRECFSQLERIKWTECKIFVPRQIKFRYDIKLPMIRYKSYQELCRKLLDSAKKPGFAVLVGQKRTSFFDHIHGCKASLYSSHTKGLF